MKKRNKLFMLVALFTTFLSSCVTNYYTMYTIEDTSIYSNSKEGAETKTIVPQGTRIYVAKGNSYRSKIKWNNYSGWISNNSYSSYNPSSLLSVSSSIDTTKRETVRYNSYPSNSSGGSVQVKGYYRKNGTYVKPHTRSAPRRR